jgi:hypothetical protein
MELTRLQPNTSILVSSSDHFFRCFFSWKGSQSAPLASFLIFPRFSGTSPDASVSGTCESRPVSSRKFHACTTRGEEGSARDTRLCFKGDAAENEDEEAGNGALNENVEVDGTCRVLSGAPLVAEASSEPGVMSDC